MVGGWEVEVTGWAAEVQDRAAGSGEGVERGGKGAAELLRVVARVVLCNDLLWEGTGQDFQRRVGQNHDLTLGLLGECPWADLMVTAATGLSVLASAC